MDFLRRLTAEDEERLIAGDAPAGGDLAELAAFTSALRSSLSSQTLPSASGAFVVRLAEITRASAETIQQPQRSRLARPRRRLALVARVAVAVATVPLVFAGLAFAGVTLPGPADEAFESIGVELPNQAADVDDDTEGTAKDGDSAGSVTGQENSAGKLGHGRLKDNPARAGARGHGKQGKGGALGKRGLAPGQIKGSGDSASGNDNAGGSSSSAGGSSGGGGSSGKPSRGSGGASGSAGGGSPQGQARGHSK